jgi:16S rRNA (uracil1498-N3)-methyltransferase
MPGLLAFRLDPVKPTEPAMAVPRLHIDEPLLEGMRLRIEGPRAHYLAHVLRLGVGADLRPFNARDGEWSARIVSVGRHSAEIETLARARAPTPEPGPALCFAPIRQSRLDWLVEKAVELGAARLVPVITRFTVVKPGRPDRLAAIAVEAAEQCGRLTVPPIDAPVPLDRWLGSLAASTRILFADEKGGSPLAEALAAGGATGMLIGPEGGFAEEERAALRAHPCVLPVSLGARILRAETAALATLACWQMLPGAPAPAR